MLCCARMQGYVLINRGFVAVAAVLVALLFAAGCGGSDESATGSSGGDTTEITVETGSLSKAAFIQKADAICTGTREEFEKQLQAAYTEEQENPPKPTETSNLNKFYETTFVDIYEEQIDEISALGAPQGDEQKIAAYLEGVQDGLAEAKEDPEAFFEPFLQKQGGFKGASKLAKEYGFRVCA